MRSSLLCLFLFSGLAGMCQNIKAVKVTELEKLISESKKPLIVNFWATWCIPCIEEIPYFEKQVAAHKDSIQLILVSLDFKEAFPDGIASMVSKRKFSSTLYWLNETRADYFCPRIDSSWSGSIPSSLFINNATRFRLFREEQLKETELNDLIHRTIHQ